MEVIPDGLMKLRNKGGPHGISPGGKDDRVPRDRRCGCGTRGGDSNIDCAGFQASVAVAGAA